VIDIPVFQRTVASEVVVCGNGGRSNRDCVIKIYPSEPNTGILFNYKQDLVSASINNVTPALSSTNLGEIPGVEHLLSALYGMYITNATVKMFGDEFPIGDGSSSIFVDAISRMGVVDQNIRRHYYKVEETISVGNNDRFITICPSRKLRISYRMGLPYPEVTHGEVKFELESENYDEIFNARTWAEKAHIEHLKSLGVLGVNDSSCLIIDGDVYTTIATYPDEAVRHKVLDLLGDLSLLYGRYVIGEIIAFNAGHKLHHELIRKLACTM